MRILIVNDDSISSPVLLPLAQWARRLGQVTVIVPKFEQSGKSHGIELHKAFEVMPVELAPGIEAYTVDSTPADCVRYGVLGMHREFAEQPKRKTFCCRFTPSGFSFDRERPFSFRQDEKKMGVQTLSTTKPWHISAVDKENCTAIWLNNSHIVYGHKRT